MRLLWDFVVPTFVFVLIATISIAVVGCSTGDGTSRSIDLTVKGTYFPGLDASTRNQIPQGGTDEKSDSTPAQLTR